MELNAQEKEQQHFKVFHVGIILYKKRFGESHILLDSSELSSNLDHCESK